MSSKSSSPEKVCEKDEDCGTNKKCLKSYSEARKGKCVRKKIMEQHELDEKNIEDSLKNKLKHNQQINSNKIKLRNPRIDNKTKEKLEQDNENLEEKNKKEEKKRKDAEENIKKRFKEYKIQHQDDMESCMICQIDIPDDEVYFNINNKTLLRTHCCNKLIHTECARMCWNNVDVERWKTCPSCRNEKSWVRLINETDGRDPNLSTSKTKSAIKARNSGVSSRSISPNVIPSRPRGIFHPYTDELNNSEIRGFERTITSNMSSYSDGENVIYNSYFRNINRGGRNNQDGYIFAIVKNNNIYNELQAFVTSFFSPLFPLNELRDTNSSDLLDNAFYPDVLEQLMEENPSMENSAYEMIDEMNDNEDMAYRRVYVNNTNHVFSDKKDIFDGETHEYLGSIDKGFPVIEYIYRNIFSVYYNNSTGGSMKRKSTRRKRLNKKKRKSTRRKR